jgi:aminopeptidase N
MQRIFLIAMLVLAFLTPKAQKNFDVLHYRYEIEVSDSSDRIFGKATIRIKALQSLKSVTLDFSREKQGKGMNVLGIYKGERDDNRLPFSNTNDKLTINFYDSVPSGTETQLTIFYQGIPADGLIISKNRYGDKTFFSDNWPNRAHFWIPCKDVPDDKASFEFLVTAPKQYRVISNGEFVLEKEDVLRNQGLAASGKICWHWKEAVPLSTKVMVIGVARFAVKEFKDSPPGIPVTAWIYPQDSAKGFHDYAVAPEILKFFSDYIGPYPYNKLANVQSKTIFGGMENASAIFYSESSVTGKGGVEDLLAHEIAHQWFGDMVSEKSFAHLWLSEGFATYFTDLYFEKKYGKDSADKRLFNERDQILAFVQKSNRTVVDSSTDLMSLLNANSYQKGGWILHMLRNEVGDSIFRKIIQAYYQAYKGGNADTRDFEKVAEIVSGKDLKWFFDQWVYRPGVPRLNFSTKMIGKEFHVILKQEAPFYRLPVEVRVIFTDNSVKNYKLNLESSTFDLNLKIGMPRNIIVDPDYKLLIWHR